MGAFTCNFIMDWLKTQLINLRWGDQLTPQDRFLAKEMTLMEVWQSSYLLPKTARIRCDRRLLRR